MLGAARITFRIHRFEILAALLVAGLAAAALAYLALEIRGIGIPAGCWPRDIDGDYGLPGCTRLLRRFWEAQGSGGDWVRAVLPFLAPILGAILGVSVVAREVELRTAELAWSLSRRRSHWLLQRLLPMLGVALGILGAVAILGWWFFDALAQARSWPEMTELSSLGIGLVARGLLATGLALLIGAISGRTLPALVLATIALVVWSLVGVPYVERQIAEERAVWQSEGEWRMGEGQLLYLRDGMFDVAQPSEKEGQPGKRIDRAERRALLQATCGSPPGDGEDETARDYWECQDRFGESIQWAYVVPQSEFGLIQAADATVSLVLGGGALLLTFGVVARRRPS